MKSFETKWKTNDGIDIYARGWEPVKNPKAVVCLVHGLGEHVSRYAHVGAALTHASYALMGFDHRGHGKSGGPRGYSPGYNSMMDDIGLLLAQARERYPGLPQFLYGHSMGGNEVINYALRRKPDLAGIIASSPLLRLTHELPAPRMTLARVMVRLYPGYTEKSGLETAAISRDRKVVDTYVNDPLIHDKVSARLFIDMYAAGEWAISHAAEFKLPLLLMHGSADRLSSPDASREFARRGGTNITLHVWEDFYHELHNEADQEQVLKMMVIWMDARL